MKPIRLHSLRTLLVPAGLTAILVSCAADAPGPYAPPPGPPPPPEVAQIQAQSNEGSLTKDEAEDSYSDPASPTEPPPPPLADAKARPKQEPAPYAPVVATPPATVETKTTSEKGKKMPGPSKPADPLYRRSRTDLGARDSAGYQGLADGDRETAAGGDFEGREAWTNPMTETAEDRQSTFAVDVDTAAYSIARRTLDSDQLPNASLVRVEEFLNYFKYDYEQPDSEGQLFSIEADGARSPVDASKLMLRVGIQAKPLSDRDRLPANLVFLFDTSCSMTSGDKLELAKTSMKLAVDRLSERDQVAITTYAGGVQVVLPPTHGDDKARIKRAIDSLQPGGGTAMASGLELAYRQAAAMLRDNSVTRIIICSDGDANIGATTPQQMLKTVEGYVKEGVFISTIGFGDGNYKDATMEQIANKGNGNYYYVDSRRQAERVFSRDLTKMIQDVAQDVKIQVEFDPGIVKAYRLVGYENRDVADRDFRNDQVDAGEIGAGHQVTALYELVMHDEASSEGAVATVRVRAKQPRGTVAKELAFTVPVEVVRRPFERAPEDFRFATAVMGGAELLRRSPYAAGWTYARVMSIISDTHPSADPDRAEFLSLMKKAAYLSGEATPVGMR
ncbi:MAG: von Willebrand factor type A domain-containing protein [Deltaproteobacteria bacterium]|jgi:Ca-activated chloride channel family protein|nr:von Willebrand factor type A domain-containing protein [Deltaproteobacteria bacterium]